MQLPRPPRSAGSHPIDTFICFGAYFHYGKRNYQFQYEIIWFSVFASDRRSIGGMEYLQVCSELERLREKLSRFYHSCMKLLHLSIWYIKLFTIVDYVYL